MDKLTDYPKLIKQILREYVELSQNHPRKDIETFLITDDEKGHYIWMNLGWENGERITGITVYVRLHNGKIWIEEDIVLAFHEPKMREYTNFAVA
jgi:hypothetical protein